MTGPKNRDGEHYFKKILWAVDAFSPEFHLQAQTGRAIRAFVGKTDAMVQPVAVIPAELPALIEGTPTFQLSKERAAEKTLEKVMKLSNLACVRKVELLLENGRSIRGAVKEVLEFADREGYDLIAVGTHGRKGVPRMFMGSFAECLLHHSRLPVLVTNPKAKYLKKVRHILFPTDFTARSRDAFGRVLDLAKEWKADVLIYHRMEFMYPELGYPFIVPPISSLSVGDMVKDRHEQGAQMVESARRKGVKAKFHLCQKREDIASSIRKAAKHFPDCLVAMASQTGPISSVLLGSVTRQVIRQSECPVLVFHPQEEVEGESRSTYETDLTSQPLLA